MFIRVKCYDLIMCHNLTVQCNFVKYEKMSVYFHISWEDLEGKVGPVKRIYLRVFSKLCVCVCVRVCMCECVCV